MMHPVDLREALALGAAGDAATSEPTKGLFFFWVAKKDLAELELRAYLNL